MIDESLALKTISKIREMLEGLDGLPDMKFQLKLFSFINFLEIFAQRDDVERNMWKALQNAASQWISKLRDTKVIELRDPKSLSGHHETQAAALELEVRIRTRSKP